MAKNRIGSWPAHQQSGHSVVRCTERAGNRRHLTLRIRARMPNGDFMELLERFELAAGQIQVGKYSLHWQGAEGILIRRWDNAPHHPETATFPHHLHEGAENNVFPHEAVDFFTVVRIIESKVLGSL